MDPKESWDVDFANFMAPVHFEHTSSKTISEEEFFEQLRSDVMAWVSSEENKNAS